MIISSGGFVLKENGFSGLEVSLGGFTMHKKKRPDTVPDALYYLIIFLLLFSRFDYFADQ